MAQHESRIDNLTGRARELIKTDLKKSLQLVARIRKLSEQYSYAKGLADSHRLQGIVYSEQNKLAKAVSAFEYALGIYTETGNYLGQAMMYNNLGNIHFKMSKFVDAIHLYFQSLKLKEKLGDKKGMISTLTNIGSVYQKQGNFKEAVKFYNKAMRQARQLKDVTLEAINCQNIGEVYIKSKSYSKARKYLMLAAEQFEKTGQYPSLVSVYINTGVVYKSEKKTEMALKMIEQAMQIARREKLKLEEALCQLDIGEILMEGKKYKEAEEHLMKVVYFMNKKTDNPNLNISLDHLARLHYRKKDYRSAYRMLNRYLSAYANSNKSEHSNQISAIHMQYEVDKREREAEIYRLKNVELKNALQNLAAEKKRSDSLLRNILPAKIVSDLYEQGSSPIKRLEKVSVMFIDIKGFTLRAQDTAPEKIVETLSRYFTRFEQITASYGIEKIKTIGDAFMCASGVPKPDRQHAIKVVNAAFDILKFAREDMKINPKEAFEVRVGIHTGPVIAGIIGTTRLAYDIWGDTVNTAARMEQTSEPGKINVTEATYKLVNKHFKCTYRGKVAAKNKGSIDMYFVDGPQPLKG